MLATVVSVESGLVVDLPTASCQKATAGAFFLGRAEDGSALDRTWENYLRVPLFPSHIAERAGGVRVSLAPVAAYPPAVEWLLARRAGDSLHLLGPLGNGFALHEATRNLLLVANAEGAPTLFPLAEQILDRGGRVALLLQGDRDQAIAIRDRIPLQVEMLSEVDQAFDAELGSMAAWADQVAFSIPHTDLGAIARVLRTARYRMEPGFAQALVFTPLPCGCGACLACIVPLAHGGFTRACIHGPVFDLTRLG